MLTQENNKTINNISSNNNNSNDKVISKKRAKISGKIFLIFKKNKNEDITSKNTNNNKNNDSIRKSKKKGIEESPNKTRYIKTSIFINNKDKENNIKKPPININRTSRQKNKSNNEHIKSNKSTIDITSRKKNILDNNSKPKNIRKTFNKKMNSISIDKRNLMNKEEEKINEFKIKKDLKVAKEIITNYLGEDNIKVYMSKAEIKFWVKMFYENKKIEMKLKLVPNEKNKCVLTGEIIQGDQKNFENLFLILKEKLK